MFRDKNFTFQQDLAPAYNSNHQKMDARKQDDRALMACQLARSQSHGQIAGNCQAEVAKTSVQQFGQLKETIHEMWGEHFP